MTISNETKSLPDLLSSLVSDMSTLFRQEVRLARTEITENVGKMFGALGMLGAAAVLLLPGLVILLQAIAAFMVAEGMQPQWAMLVVSIVVLGIAIILLSIGLGRLKAASLTPDKTIDQVRRDAAVAKEQVR